MALTVREAKTRREVRDFVDLAWALNAHDPIWTPPLRQDFLRMLSGENPLWQKGRGERALLVAYEGERPVGRVMAHVHHASNERHGEKAGFFGFLETPDDPAIAKALLDAAGARHRAQGLTELRGPYEPTIQLCIGAVTAGFDEAPAFNQSWNPPHVPRLLEGYGMEVCYRAATFRSDDVQGFDPDTVIGEKQRAWLKDPRVRLRTFDMDRFEADLDAATALLNAGFADNFGFVPLSRDEIDFMAGPMKRVVRPELTVFLEYEGKPVAVGMALPDFNVLFRRMNGDLFPLGWAKFLLGSRALDAAVGQFIATSPELQNKGLMRIVIGELMRKLKANGFRTFEGTWIGDVNVKSRKQVLAIGMREKHQLALYRRPL